MSYLCYLCLFSHSGVQHILRCVFLLFFFVLCSLFCPFLWFVLFWLLLRYSLTLNNINVQKQYTPTIVHNRWNLRFYCYHFVDISAGGLFVPESIIRPCTFKCFGQLFTFPLYFERTLWRLFQKCVVCTKLDFFLL